MRVFSEEEYKEQANVHSREVNEFNFGYTSSDSDSNGGSSSVLMTFLKSVRPGMDLTQMCAPMFVVKPISLLEKLADAYRPTDSLLKVCHMKNQRDRMLAVIEYYVGNLRSEPKTSFKNISPYNPILGEQFICEYHHNEFSLKEDEPEHYPDNFEQNTRKSVTNAWLEQVSHHPPISAVHIENRNAGFVFRTTQAMTVKLGLNKVTGKVSGTNELHVLGPWNEMYEMEHPHYIGRGIILGSSCFELSDELTIVCQKTNMKAVIKFSSGSTISGEVFENNKKIMKMKGSFITDLTVVECDTKSSRKLIDFTKERVYMKIVKPVYEQSENESHRVWHGVTHALKELKNEDLASKIKSEIEENQRKIVALRKEKKVPEYTPQIFSNSDQKQNSSVPFMIKNDSEIVDVEDCLD
jgi:hypothetical protein